MRALPQALANHLAEGVTTLCWCWKWTRTDGTVLGFTDHDVDVTFDGVTYEAASGFTASAVDSDLGLSVPTMDVEGALSSDNLTDEDLQSGLWDNSGIELYRVNWDDPTQRALIRRGGVGEVSRNQQTFLAELRSMTHELDQPTGRTYTYSCDANLGDARCGVDTSAGAYQALEPVVEILGGNRWFRFNPVNNTPVGWYNGGTLTWQTGSNTGLVFEIRNHTVIGGSHQVELWFPPPNDIAVGDSFLIVVGCDKQASTCRYRFNNLVNFRGFPHMPDPSRVFAYPDPNAIHDGGSLYSGEGS